MKKIFTLCAVAVLSLSTAFAQLPQTRKFAAKQQSSQASISMTQAPKSAAKTVISSFPYSEGFENGSSDWTLIDNDNDGNNWTVVTAADGISNHSGSSCIMSDSWSSTTGSALTPDNWLISSAMQIPAGSSFELSWYDAAQDPSYPADVYSVYIATGNTVADFTATTAVFNITLSDSTWTKRTVSMASYAGQTVYVAFRHHNCTDQFRMKLDDIRVGVAGAPEVTLSGAAYGLANDTLAFSASCSDANATINWIVSGTTPSATTGASITAVWASAGTYTVQAFASNANGADTATMSVTIISCDAVTALPWEEGFEAGQGCWQFIDNDNNDNNWSVMTGAPHSGSYSLVAQYSSTQEDNWAISQAVTIPANAADINLSWYAAAYSSYYPETYEVLISTTGASTLTAFDSVFGETISATEYTKRTVSLASYAGQTVNIAFRYRSTDMYILLIDDVRIGGPQTPEGVAINGPVEVIAGTSATYVASSLSPDATYSWTFSGATPATATGDTVSVVWASAGNYTVELTATNAAGSTVDTLDVTVIQCDAITELPYSVDFTTATSLGCWTSVDANNDGSTWYLYSPIGVVNWSVNSENGDPISQDDYLVSPAVTLPQGNIELAWSASLGNSNYPGDKYTVYVSTTGNTAADFTTALFTETLNSADIASHIVDLSAYAGQTVYIAFRHYDCNALALVVQNFELRAQAAPAVTLNAPATAMTGVEVALSAVSDNADSYSWTIEGATPATATTASVTAVWDNAGTYTISVTATNTAGSTTATATINVISCDPITSFPYVMGFEANDDLSCWSFFDADGDGFNWATNNFGSTGQGYDGSDYIMASLSYDNATQSALTPDNWLFTPALAIPAGSSFELTWAEKGQDASYATEHYAVYVATTPAVNNSLTPAYEGDATPNWITRSVDLSAYAGQTVYIGFRHYNVTDMFMLDIDNVRVGDHVGISEVSDQNVSLYPNPTSGMLYINAADVQSVSVIDINGRTVMSQNNGSAIDMSNLPNGTYFVRTLTANGTSIQKVVKK